jgi:hypothetical protein
MSDRDSVRRGIRAGLARVGLVLLWGLAPILGLIFQASLQQKDEPLHTPPMR